MGIEKREFESDNNVGKKTEEKWNELISNESNEYISFTIARYALTDVIEEITAAKAINP